ncbi:hypothetical protein BDF19DRAFT_441222 [Syncephalis fuscata]|nr:hypothetical protein BDF19DRAFT_441222 [Syncephalis fuscata]
MLLVITITGDYRYHHLIISRVKWITTASIITLVICLHVHFHNCLFFYTVIDFLVTFDCFIRCYFFTPFELLLDY